MRIGEGGGKAILLIYMKSKTAPIIVALLIPIVSVAVLVPNELGVNISAKQRYEMVVRVGEGGKIIVESMEKY